MLRLVSQEASMAEKDEKDKDTRVRADTRGGEADRDARTARSADDRDDDDDRARRRRDLRDTGRSARRASNDFLTAGCGVFGDLLIGLGEALTPRSRSSRSRDVDEDDDDRSPSNCWDQFGFELRSTYNRDDDDDSKGRGRSTERR
jgi:hypothetical protein